MSRNLFEYSKQNELLFNGKSFLQLNELKNYTEPFLVYDLELIKARVELVQAWPKLTRMHFAMKANYNAEILKCIKNLGAGLDVVSGGELAYGLELGFKPEDIIFSGVGKTQSELELALIKQIKQINVESVSELKRIASLAHELNLPVTVGLRLNPLIETPTHPYISTALKDSKFGIDLEDLNDCFEVLKKSKHLNLVCLSYHIGSQILEPRVFLESLQKMLFIYNETKKQFSSLLRLDIGGGLGIDYKNHDLLLDVNRWVEMIRLLDIELDSFKDEIVCELGRFIVARAGVLVTQVQYLKKSQMLVLDVGMNNNHRPSLYQAYHAFFNLMKKSEQLKEYSLVGPICESSDVFHKKFNLFQTEELDFLVMADCGAYVSSMASEYNKKNKAPEVFME